MRKRNILIMLATIVFILSFLTVWYLDEIFNKMFIFSFGIILILLIIYTVCLVLSIIYIIRNHKSFVDYIAVIILILNIVILFNFPFNESKINIELKIYEKQRKEVVQMVKENKLKTDTRGNASLPSKYKKISSSGEIVVYQNNDEGVVVGFWIVRGMMSSYSMIMYSSEGKEIIEENIMGDIIEIEQLKEHWYYVIAE